MTRRILSICLSAAVLGAAATASQGSVQKELGRVVGVRSGDTLLVRTAKRTIAVPILGVHAPAGKSCYARESLAATRSLALGKQVALIGSANPAKGAYVSSAAGDLGFLLLSRGAVEVDTLGKPFDRIGQYAAVQEAVQQSATGMWGACAADVSVSVRGPESAFVGQAIPYTVLVSNAGPLTARNVELQLRPGAYAENVVSAKSDTASCAARGWWGTCTIAELAPGASTTVTLTLRGSRFGALSARAEVALPGCIAAQCAGSPLIDQDLSNNRAAVVTTLPGGGYERACDKSYPTVCIPLTPPDLDCEDFLPLRNFTVRHDLPDADPHHLDGNGDGIGCEEEDY
jgi:endonuclease YncB( thermonuclease family)